MNLKRLIGSVAIAGVVGASTLGIGAGIANANPASPAQSSSATAVVQPAYWHGGGGYGFRHRGGYGYFRHGFPGYFGHPFGRPWGWRR
jgi:hypothetical protein